MRLKSNSPTQPSGDVGRWWGCRSSNMGRHPPNYERMTKFWFSWPRRFPSFPYASFVYLILNHDEATLTTLRRLSRRNSFLQFHAGSMRENALLRNLLLLSSLLRSPFQRSSVRSLCTENFFLYDCTSAVINLLVDWKAFNFIEMCKCCYCCCVQICISAVWYNDIIPIIKKKSLWYFMQKKWFLTIFYCAFCEIFSISL